MEERKEGGKKRGRRWGKRERGRRRGRWAERLIYSIEYNFLYTNLNTRVVILFLGNDDLNHHRWCLCKGDSLVFLRHENKIESSRVTAFNPLLDGILVT